MQHAQREFVVFLWPDWVELKAGNTDTARIYKTQPLLGGRILAGVESNPWPSVSSGQVVQIAVFTLQGLTTEQLSKHTEKLDLSSIQQSTLAKGTVLTTSVFCLRILHVWCWSLLKLGNGWCSTQDTCKHCSKGTKWDACCFCGPQKHGENSF